MKLLVVFLLAVLGCSLAEAKLVSKCELRDQLKAAVSNLMLKAKANAVTVDNLVARIACHAEKSSGFNTSAVKELIGKEVCHSGEQKDHTRGRRHVKGSSSQLTHPPQNCTLYGVFQLSSCQACNDSVTPTANICGIPCSNLLNDDISADISCLLKILLSPGGVKTWKALEDRVESIVEEKCEEVRASVYFSGCL